MLTIILTVWVPLFGCCHVTEGVKAYPTKTECDQAVAQAVVGGKLGDPKLWSCKETDKAPDPLPAMPGMNHHH